MPPKSKSNSSKGKKLIGKDAWRSELESAIINDDRWWCMVTMMVETRLDHSQCVSIFNEAIEDGKRKTIYALSRQNTINSVRILAEPDPDKCPLMQSVCHYANEVLTQNDEALPSWLMARVIKYLIHRVKVEVVSRTKRQAELERDVEQELRMAHAVADFGSNGGSKQKTAPIGGPDLYIVLSRFYDPTLPLELIKVGVPLTCILEIKRSEGTFERDDENESISAGLISGEKTLKIIDEGCPSKADMHEFWMSFEKGFYDWQNIYDYCGLMRRALYLPIVFASPGDLEREELKTIVCDTVCCEVYDLYRIYRQHVSYLRSMRLQPNLAEQRVENQEMRNYAAFMDAVPAECSFVPIILHALLVQVEINMLSAVSTSPLNGNVEENHEELVKETVLLSNKTSSCEESSLNSCMEKLVRMNQKYDLVSSIERDSLVRDPELILHGDALNANTCHLYVDPEDTDTPRLTVIGKRVLENSRIARLWNNVEEVVEDNLTKYSYHINRIARCFDQKPMDDESVRHYIHLLLFDRMIQGRECLLGPNEKAKSERRVSFSDRYILKSKRGSKQSLSDTLISQATKSSLPSDKIAPPCSRSDSSIDYLKTMSETFECPLLFRLIDIRGMIQPGFLENVERSDKVRSSHQEFDAVQLLSSEVFLQTVHDCLRDFDQIEHEYFEPTDSILLYFHNVCKVEEVIERAYNASIRTPVCLRDFYEYVLAEEQDWMRREDARHEEELDKIAEEQLKIADTNASVPTTSYTDDFSLPSSLSTEKKKGSGKEKKEASTRDKSSKGKGQEGKISDLKSSFTPFVQCTLEDEPYEFVGYDLGNFRIQVSGTNKTFLSADGTLIRVHHEEWLYQRTELHITIGHSDCNLVLHSTMRNARSAMELFPFHLLTKEGIILAFSKSPVTNLSNETLSRRQSRDLSFDFRASWPSGLIVEPIVGDGPENPFYISQRYVSKGPECVDIARESYRKFLRNGTVLKFLDDDTVTVLRPNGTVVECVAFQKLNSLFSVLERSAESTPRADKTKTKSTRSSKMSVMSRTRRLSSVIRSRPRGLAEDVQSLKQVSLVEGQGLFYSRTSNLQTRRFSSMEDITRLQVSQYTVLEHDGKHYEVLYGRIVRELDRLLVRTASDFEVDEKFTRRADGTDTLINSNGEMIVSFPDGTRITTGYVVEENPVICDWSEDEFSRLFSFERSSETSKKNTDSRISSNSRRSRPYADANRMTDDAFVSVLLTCRMEHKNYATVMYNQAEIDCTLLMPGNVDVRLSHDGLCDVTVNSKVTLKVRETSLTYSNNVCTTCDGTSTSIYKFDSFESNPEGETADYSLLRTTDMFGNVFEVNRDGTTHYQSSNESSSPRETRNKVETKTHRNEKKEEHVDKDEKLKNGIRRTRCLPEGFTPSDRYRIFAMNRDLTAYEYVHRSARMEQERETCSDDKSSMLLRPVPGRPVLHYHVTLTPLNPKTISKTWLQAYCVPRVRLTNYDRTDLLRSTYSIPYDWLFPYGKNENGIWTNTWNMSLGDRVESSIPDRLKIRILREIKLDDEDSTIGLQKALGRYWRTVINEFGKYRSYRPKDGRTTEERNSENWLEELALGRKKTMDVEMYVCGLARNRIKPRRGSTSRRCCLDRFFEQRLSKREEVKWYQMCARKTIYIPYFVDVPGACFLWVKECIERALKIATSVDLSFSNLSEESNKATDGYLTIRAEPSADRYSTDDSRSRLQGSIDEEIVRT